MLLVGVYLLGERCVVDFRRNRASKGAIIERLCCEEIFEAFDYRKRQVYLLFDSKVRCFDGLFTCTMVGREGSKTLGMKSHRHSK